MIRGLWYVYVEVCARTTFSILTVSNFCKFTYKTDLGIVLEVCAPTKTKLGTDLRDIIVIGTHSKYELPQHPLKTSKMMPLSRCLKEPILDPPRCSLIVYL